MIDWIKTRLGVKKLEDSINVLEGRCNIYEGLVSAYIAEQEQQGQLIDDLLGLNQRLINILNEHMLDTIAKTDTDNNSIQNVNNQIRDITLRNGLGESYRRE